MDAKFLEFWSELLKSAAGQHRMDEAFRWIGRGLRCRDLVPPGLPAGFNDVAALFRRAYGLEGTSDKTADFGERWKRAADDFQKSMNQYLSLIGVVSLNDHLDVVAKYEDLKKKAASQEETIEHLRTLLEGRRGGQENLQRGLQDLMTLQTEQFRELMQRLGLLPGKPDR